MHHTAPGRLCNSVIPGTTRLAGIGQRGEGHNAEWGQVLDRHASPLACAVGFKRGGVSHLAAGTDGGEVLVFALIGEPRLIGTLARQADAITALAWGGGLLFVVCANGTVSWHNCRTFEQMCDAPQAHTPKAHAAAALGERGFASAGGDRVLRLWLAQGDVAYAMPHAVAPGALAASPCGRWLASGSEDGTIVVFDCHHRRFGAMRRISTAGISTLCWPLRAGGFVAADTAGALHRVTVPDAAAANLAA
jgi:hypothetical protein